MPSPESGPSRVTLAAALLVALIFRCGALGLAPPLSIDETRYLVVAHHLRHGLGYTNWNGSETHVHPLHPALTALAGAGLESLQVRGRLVTLLASILLLIPIALLAGRLGGRSAATLALFLLAVHPWLVRASPTVQPESLYVLLVACGLLILLGAAEPRHTSAGSRSASWRSGAAGLLFGLAYLARPEGMLIGLLACGIVMVPARAAGRAGLKGALVFLLGLALAAGPYVGFLRRATGEWTITGKSAHVFFVDQSVHLTRDLQDAPRIQGEMMARYRGVIPYAAAHPARVLRAAAANGIHIGFNVLPRALGPLGLLGLGVWAVILARKKGLRRASLLVASPCFTLVLLLVTFPNDRVAATTLPFLLVLASQGLAAGLAWVPPRWIGWRRTLLLAVFASLALAGWAPAVWRAFARPRDRGDARLVTEAIDQASSTPGGQDGFITDNVVLSFYARDPRLFGPAGRYRLFRFDAPCAAIASTMREQGVRLALLDLNGIPAAPDIGAPECPLRLVGRVDDPGSGRLVLILTLPAGPGALGREAAPRPLPPAALRDYH